MPDIAVMSDDLIKTCGNCTGGASASRGGKSGLTFIDTGFWIDLDANAYRRYLQRLAPTNWETDMCGSYWECDYFASNDAERMLDQLCRTILARS
jgi:hypothetical protein